MIKWRWIAVLGLVVTLLALGNAVAEEYSIKENGVTFTLDDTGTLTIIGDGVNGTGTNGMGVVQSIPDGIAPDDVISVVVGENIEALSGTGNLFSGFANLQSAELQNGVVSLCNGAFSNCSGLQTVKLPATLQTIPIGCFQNCSRLTAVTLSSGVDTIDNYAFCNCTVLQQIALPDTLKTIGDQAFYGDSVLTGLVLPNGLRTIGTNAFGMCRSIESLRIPGSLDEVGKLAFYECTGLRTLVVEEGVKSLGPNAFMMISSPVPSLSVLDSVTLPEGLTQIGELCFSGCSALKEIALPTTLTQIGYAAFTNCGLTEITIPAGVTSLENEQFASNPLQKIWLLGANTTINIGGFDGLSDADVWCPAGSQTMQSVRNTNAYSATIHSLGLPDYSVDENGVLTSVNVTRNIQCIPDEVDGRFVTSIAGGAFVGDTWARMLFVPETVTVLKTGAVKDCTQLSVIHLPSSVATIETGAIDNCNAQYVIIDNPEAEIKKSAIVAMSPTIGCHRNSTAESYAVGNGFNVYYQENNFQVEDGVLKSYAGFSSDVVIPENLGITRIGKNAFKLNYNGSPRSVTIPEGVTAIDDRAFDGCMNLAAVDLPTTLKTIGTGAFAGTAVVAPTLPEGLESIGQEAFYGDEALNAVRIPASVTFIGPAAFADCPNLESFGLEEGNANYSYDPDAKMLYRTAGGGSALSACLDMSLTRYEPAASVNEVLEGAFTACRGLTYAALPEGMTGIPVTCFSGCSMLTDVSFPESLTTIGAYAFESCDSLEVMTLPEGVTSLSEGAFRFCDKLRVVGLPRSLANVGDYVLADCPALEQIIYAGDPDSWFSIDFGEEEYVVRPELTCMVLYEVQIGDEDNDVRLLLSGDGTLYVHGEGVLDSSRMPPRIPYVGDEPLTKAGSFDILTAIPGQGRFESVKYSVLRPGSDGSIHFHVVPLVICEGITGIVDNSEAGIGFGRYNYISSFYLPASLTQIDMMPLTTEVTESINVNADNPEYMSIEGVLFSKDGKRLIAFPPRLGNSYTVPEGVETIAMGAFGQCQLDSLSLPEGLKTIDAYAFYGAYLQKSDLLLPDGLKTIGDYAFSDAYGPKRLVLPESLEAIGEGAFVFMNNTAYIALPENVSVGDYAFEGCMAYVMFPMQMGQLGQTDGSIGVICYPDSSVDAWAQENNCSDIQYYEPCMFIEWEGGSIEMPSEINMLLGDSTRIEPRLRPSCFNGLDVALSVEDASVAVISETNELSGLTVGETTLVASVIDETIEEEVTVRTIVRMIDPAMREADLVLPENLKDIESEAFAGTDVRVIACPIGLQSIGEKAFANCASLDQIIIPENVDSGSAESSVNIPTALSIEADAFEGCKPGLIIFGTPGGMAQRFAEEKGILFVPIEQE